MASGNQCVEGNGCENCAFKGRKCYLEGGTDDPIGEYCYDRRRDSKDVIFKKLEKVGEPYMVYGHIVQKYKFFHSPAIQIKGMSVLRTINSTNTIAIEIKQNKEDMGERNDIRPYNEYFSEGTVSNTKHLVTSNLKPFNLEAAKAGKPVCTRDGRKARIICFDAKGDKPIIALIEYEIDERPCNYFANGRFYSNPNENNDADLMMLPEKRSGWAKVRKDINLYDTKEEADRKMIGNDEYVTAKVFWEE